MSDHEKLIDLAQAVFAYDRSIYGKAARGEYSISKDGTAYAEDVNLDALYLAMVNKAREVLGLNLIVPEPEDGE